MKVFGGREGYIAQLFQGRGRDRGGSSHGWSVVRFQVPQASRDGEPAAFRQGV